MTLAGNSDAPGQFVLRTLNDIVAKDKVTFTSGGALAGLSAFTQIQTLTDLSRVQIGAGAHLSSVGDINISARGQGDIAAVVDAQAYGVGTYIAAGATARITPHNEVIILGDGSNDVPAGTALTLPSSNTILKAKGDINITAGTDADFHRDNYTIDARTDTLAGSLVPLGDVNSTTILITDNKISTAAGSNLLSAGTIRFNADRKGLADLSGSAKATSWVSEVQDFLNGAAAAAMNDATIHQEGHGIVQVDGVVQTGTERNKSLTLTGWNDVNAQITGYTQTGWDADDVIFTSKFEVVSSDLLDDLDFAKQQLNLYGDVNDTLRNFYQTEVSRIQSELAKNGLFQFLYIDLPAHGLNTGDTVVYHSATPGTGGDIGGLVDGQTYIVRKISVNKLALQLVAGGPGNDIKYNPKNTSDFNQSLVHGSTTLAFNLSSLNGIAVGQQAITITINPIHAEAGKIDVRGDQLQGTGRFIAPGDASVNIQNHTPGFLKIMGIDIPESNGGLYLNGTPITTNAQITASNVAARDDDNRNQVPGETIQVAGNAGFVAIPNNATSTPTIVVNNDFIAGPQSNGAVYPWPNITVLGEISNLGGNVTLQTHPAGEGNVIIKANVEAKNLTVVAGGSVFITGVTKYDVLGDPAAIWGDITQGVVQGDTSGTLYDGVAAASTTDINNLLSVHPTTPNLIGDRVVIDAEFINVNGVIQSGKDSYSLTIGVDTANEISGISPADGTLVVLTTASSNDFIVRYNTTTGQIEVDPLRVRGGYVDLTGHILNAGNGLIKVLGGHADFNIVNLTAYALVINRIDDSQPGQGTLIIKDKAKGTTTNPYVTLYQKTGNSVHVTEDDGVGGFSGTIQSDVGVNTSYTPDSGWRYGWSVGVETKDYYYYHHDTTAWLGIDWLSADPASISWDSHELLDTPKILPDSSYFFKDTSTNAAYTFEEHDVPTQPLTVHIIDDHVDTTWYGKSTYHNEIEAESRTLHIYTHTIEADRPIDIKFIGDADGGININSVGDVVVRGPIMNPDGTTTIATQGAIVQSGDDAFISGRRIELSAKNGIGAGTALRTDVTDGAGASLKAVTTSGAVQISEISGDLYVDQIVSQHNILGSGAKVTLDAAGGIVVGANKSGTSYTGLVEGGAISLTTGTGGIGSAAHSLLLDSGSFQWDKVNIDSHGAAYVTEKSGSLRIESITSSGDVHIQVNAGGIIDANESEIRDERTYDQLKGGVWHDLQLTDSTGAQDKIQDALDSLAAIKEQEYATYWVYRASQDSAMSGQMENGGKYIVVTDFRSFTALDVDGTADTIDLGTGSGLAVGDHVQYHNGGGESIGGLVDGQTYTIDAIIGGNIHLAGVATAHADFNPVGNISGTDIDLGVAHGGFISGDAVRYVNGDVGPGKHDIGGLESGKVYYVNVSVTGKVRLAATKADALAGTHLLSLDGAVATGGAVHSFDAVLDKYVGAAAGHRFDLLDSENIKLAASVADATAATPIVLDLNAALSSGAGHKLLKAGVVVGSAFDPSAVVGQRQRHHKPGCKRTRRGRRGRLQVSRLRRQLPCLAVRERRSELSRLLRHARPEPGTNRRGHRNTGELPHRAVPHPECAIRQLRRHVQRGLPLRAVRR